MLGFHASIKLCHGIGLTAALLRLSAVQKAVAPASLIFPVPDRAEVCPWPASLTVPQTNSENVQVKSNYKSVLCRV